MTIVLTGGGSGGHVTPLVAVAAELKQRQPKARLVYIGQKGDRFADIMADDPNIDAAYSVRAGKFRRYHGEGLKQLLDLRTMFLNARDAIYVVVGLWQSWRLMKRLRPRIVFSRGGFVSVPVSIGAKLRNIPYITHDSDRIPSLANRLIARWARRHAVAFPVEVYPYPADRTVQTGIPLRKEFAPVNKQQQLAFRKEIEVPPKARMVFVIGGGLGAVGVNQAVSEALPHVLHEHPDVHVVHVVGQAREAATMQAYAAALSPTEQGRVRVFGYIDDVYKYSGAADVVISRAGATNLAEFAVQGKACIIIPASFLSGGHQVENAQYLADENAIIMLDEDTLLADSNRLARRLSELLGDTEERAALGRAFTAFAQPDATQRLAALILDEAKQ